MSSNDIKFYMDGFYTSISFQKYLEHKIWSPNEEVMQVTMQKEFQPAIAGEQCPLQRATATEGKKPAATGKTPVATGKMPVATFRRGF